MTAIQLRADLLRELNSIFDSKTAMEKALTALRDIRRTVLDVPAVKSTKRKGWAAAAKRAHEQGDDQLIAADVFEDDKVEEWKW